MICKLSDAVDSHIFLKSFQNLNELRLEVVLWNGGRGNDVDLVDSLSNFLVNCPVTKMHLSVSRFARFFTRPSKLTENTKGNINPFRKQHFESFQSSSQQ